MYCSLEVDGGRKGLFSLLQELKTREFLRSLGVSHCPPHVPLPRPPPAQGPLWEGGSTGPGHKESKEGMEEDGSMGHKLDTGTGNKGEDGAAY